MGLRRILALELVLRGTLRDLGPPVEGSPSRHCKEVTGSLLVSSNEREDCRAEVEGATDKQHVKPTTAHRMSGMGRLAGRAKMVILADRSRDSQALGQVRGEGRKGEQEGHGLLKFSRLRRRLPSSSGRPGQDIHLVRLDVGQGPDLGSANLRGGEPGETWASRGWATCGGAGEEEGG